MAFNINASALSAFGLHTKKVVREKSYFICDTGNGLVKLARAVCAPEQIMFTHTVKEHAAESGYPWADRFLIAESGLPYAAAANEVWTASAYVKGREADFENKDETVKIISAVRGWHACARGVPHNDGEHVSQPLTDFFRKQAAELGAIAKRVRRQSKLSDFDVLFIKNAAFYGERIKNALLLLEQSEYLKLHRQACENGRVCHHGLKEESLTLAGGDVYITHYEEASFDAQLTDIASIIRRYARRAGQNAVPASLILEAASAPEPFSAAEVDVLYALLLFPWNFMKTTTLYYSKKRTWTPNAIINRMQTVIDEAAFFNEYIKEFERGR